MLSLQRMNLREKYSKSRSRVVRITKIIPNTFGMKNYALLFTILLVTLTVGCTQRSIPVASMPAGQMPQQIVKEEPSKVEIAVPVVEEVVAEICEPEPVEPECEKAAVPSHSFSEAETAHVRCNTYNPFPDGKDKFTINLDEVRDQFCYPYEGKHISAYGMRGRSMHTGSDIKGIPGDTIRAAFDGVVRLAKPYSGYGNVIVIRHDNGLETVYAHNSKNIAKVGQSVKSGQAIGLIGRTGRATTEHLHFEVRIQGQHINPALLLDLENKCLQSGTFTVTRSGAQIAAVTKRHDGRAIESKSNAVPAAPNSSQTNAVLAKSSSGSGNSTSAASTSGASSSAAAAKYHTIVKGDTLSALAKRYGTSVTTICKLSGISATTVLQLGKKLRVH